MFKLILNIRCSRSILLSVLFLMGFSSNAIGQSAYRFVKFEGATDAFVLTSSQTRFWVSSSCVQQMTQSGLTPDRVYNWESDVAPYTAASNKPCSQLIQWVSAGTSSDANNPTQSTSNTHWQVVTVSDNGDGFLLFGNGERQWLESSCIVQLRNSSVSIQRVAWSVVSPNTQTSNRVACTDIASSLGQSSSNYSTSSNPTNSDWRVVTVTANGDGFLLFGNGTRQWLNSNCISQLRNSQVSIEMVNWSVVEPNASTNSSVSCNDIAIALGSSNPQNNSNNSAQTAQVDSLDYVNLNSDYGEDYIGDLLTLTVVEQSLRSSASTGSVNWRSSEGARCLYNHRILTGQQIGFYGDSTPRRNSRWYFDGKFLKLQLPIEGKWLTMFRKKVKRAENAYDHSVWFNPKGGIYYTYKQNINGVVKKYKRKILGIKNKNNGKWPFSYTASGGAAYCFNPNWGLTSHPAFGVDDIKTDSNLWDASLECQNPRVYTLNHGGSVRERVQAAVMDNHGNFPTSTVYDKFHPMSDSLTRFQLCNNNGKTHIAYPVNYRNVASDDSVLVVTKVNRSSSNYKKANWSLELAPSACDTNITMWGLLEGLPNAETAVELINHLSFKLLDIETHSTSCHAFLDENDKPYKIPLSVFNGAVGYDQFVLSQSHQNISVHNHATGGITDNAYRDLGSSVAPTVHSFCKRKASGGISSCLALPKLDVSIY